MRSRASEHSETVSRRLALLSEQLAASRDDVPDRPGPGADWWRDHTRVSATGPAPEPLPDQPHQPAAVAPSVVPVPGRHAARRRLTPADLLPDTLRGRLRLGPGQVAVVAVLVAVALAVTCWVVVRDDPAAPVVAPPAGGLVAVTATAPEAATPSLPTGSSAPPGSGEAAQGSLTVDVAGKVRRPGIVVLEPGARVIDALEAAGGARPAVDLTSLNLARPLVDGEQILVGVHAPVAPPGVVPPPTSDPGASTALVDLNLADQAELETLPDVGPVTAAAIIAWREEHGGFTAVTELLEVDGIGDATLATLTPLVTV